MSRSDNPYDNAEAESFIKTVSAEAVVQFENQHAPHPVKTTGRFRPL